jgi:cell division protein FtsW
MSTAAAKSGRTSAFKAFGAARQASMHQPDYWLMTIVLIMVMFGTVMVFSSSFAIGVREEGGDGYYFLTRHLIYLIIGLAGMLIAMSIDYHVWRRFALPALLGVMAVLAAMVLFPSIAPEVWGASRWIAIGPVSFQPSELAKLALIIYLASWLASKGHRIREVSYGLIPFAVLMGILVGLVMLQPDLGTSMLLTAIGLSMFLVAGANLLHISIVSIVGGLAFLALALSASYRRDRILVFLNPDADLRNLGWQLAHAKLAIGSGGLFGVGLGASKQKFAWLPAAHNDAIFAVIAEELGLIGAGFVLILFAALAWRGYEVAKGAPDAFGALIAVGIVTWMVFQAGINIGGITTTIPFTGIPIPFISYGGSSLVVSLTAMGILLNISRQTVDPVEVRVKTSMQRRSTKVRKRTVTAGPDESEPQGWTPPRKQERPKVHPQPKPMVGSTSARSGGSGSVRSVDGRTRSSSGRFGRGQESTARMRR